MTNNKQSSVEYLIEHLLPKALTVEQYYHIEKAKAMHKDEMIKLYNDYQDYLDEEFKNQCGGQGNILTFEQYYNETFGGGNK